MVALGGLLGLIILVFGVSTFSAGLNPTTLALIGLPIGAAIHSVQDMQEIRNERMYEMNQQPDTVAVDSAVYFENSDESNSYVTEAYYDTLACPDSEWYQGTWRYTRITQNGVDVTTLTENDTLYFNSNRFRYDIEALNKHSNGIFSTVELQSKCAFNFMYLAPDGAQFEQIRTFEIDYINRDSLCISEGPLLFEYRKK